MNEHMICLMSTPQYIILYNSISTIKAMLGVSYCAVLVVVFEGHSTIIKHTKSQFCKGCLVQHRNYTSSICCRRCLRSRYSGCVLDGHGPLVSERTTTTPMLLFYS